ncbi:MAG TPA: GH116 family glycosyl hydrolase [Mycobacteriales bacterium]|nr:GH116 family glycosyl hydrolase [Mycobacteriales bacterium]
MRRRACAVLIAIAALIAGVLTAGAAPAAAAAPPIHWNFEDGTLQGWTAEPGSNLGPPITSRVYYHNNPTIKWNKEGTYFLSTEEDPNGKYNDGYTGVLNSPQFTLTEPIVSMLVAGGSSATTYIAACLPDPDQPHGCQVVEKTAGVNAEPFILRTMDLSKHVGDTMFLQIVDENTGGWGHLTVDDIHVNYPPTPQHITVDRTAQSVQLSWDKVAGTGYHVYRSTEQNSGYARVDQTPVTATSFVDRSADPGTAYFYRVTATFADGRESDGSQTAAYARPYQDVQAPGSTVTYSGDKLSGIEFPVGPMGAGGILHFGDGTRNESWIFNHNDAFADRHSGNVPNSFFAIRAGSQVRALQTVDQGPFPKMQSLTFQGEYPLAHYRYQDQSLPVQVTEDVSNPTIPGDLKDSAIPTALYTFTVKNSSTRPVSFSLLASQQNAVGFDGVGTVGGANSDSFSGYGDNANAVDGSSLSMTGSAGSMVLSMGGSHTSSTAAWTDPSALLESFRSGDLTGPAQAKSPAGGVTVDGALASSVSLRPGQQVQIPVRLSWNFPNGPTRGFGGEGEQYTNWWADASAVDDYVAAHYDSLTTRTRQFHDTLYSSNLPHYVLDRLTSGIAVLHTPSVFWAKNGFFGGWEGYGCCWGMPNHVWEYAQTASALWPQVGRMWTGQWLDAEQPDGLLPFRFNTATDKYGLAFDGQAGVILSAYRTYLQSTDKSWLQQYWPRIQKAMDYLIQNNDPDRDGLLTGAQPTTLDSAESGTGSWLGSLYLAALNATAHMGALAGDSSAGSYTQLYETGRANQEKLLWNGSYYEEKPESLANTVSYGSGSAADMLLGQWWSSQLGLGDIYDPSHMDTATRSLFANNYRSNFFGFEMDGRVYAEPTDPGLLMITWPKGGRPANASPYHDETWTGTEYSAAATMIQRGDVADGLRVVRAAADRNDGRLRTDLTLGGCGAGDGGGNPFGDVECGQWYSRSMSGWSVLTALQGATYDGPAQYISFAPKWQPADHRSFFTAGTAFGTFTQQRRRDGQTDSIAVTSGSVVLRQIAVVADRPGAVTVSLGGHRIDAQAQRAGQAVTVTIPPTTVRDGTTLTVHIG